MLKKIDITYCKPTPTPIAHGVVLCRDDSVEMDDETLVEVLLGA